METEKLAVIGLVVLIVGAISIYLIANEEFFQADEKVVIEKGDAVQVVYTGKFQVNDTVFDTSVEEVAKEAGIYEELHSYEPIKVFVNPDGDLDLPDEYANDYNTMIPGFLNGLIGMNKGETKTLTIQPEDAYGTWNTSLAESLEMGSTPLDSEMASVVTENKTIFLEQFTDVTLEEDTVFDYGSFAFLQDGVFNATITNITDDDVTYKLIPENGTTLMFPYFNWDVVFTIVNDTTISMHSNAEVDHTFTIPSYFGSIHFKVVEVNETHAEFAVNMQAPELQFIDQILVFEIEVVSIDYDKSVQEES